MVLARQFPRNEVLAIDRIKNAFSRQRLAETATYIYTRGGNDVSGPSIRAAEAVAQSWGNVQFGFREIERGVDKGVGYSEVEAYAWDIESNTKRALQFRVSHIRQTRKGTAPLVDERDIYELVANQAQRRVRAGKIPAAKIGRAWVIFKQDLLNYLRQVQNEPCLSMHGKEKPCHCTKEKISGSFTSHAQTVRELDRLLGLSTGGKHNGSTIN